MRVKLKYFYAITTPSINNDQRNLCKRVSSETDFYIAKKNMQINKSPVTDGLTKKFYVGFLNETKLFIASRRQAREKRYIKS